MLTLALLMGTIATGFAQSQEQSAEGFSGQVSAQGGLGSANPWDGQIDLQYRNKHVLVRPFAGITGISRSSSEQEEKLDLTYATGYKHHTSDTYKEKGTLLQFGTDLGFFLNPKSALKLGIKVDRDNLKTYGSGYTNVNDITDHHYNIHSPKHNRRDIHTTASFEQALNSQHKLTFDYSYDKSEVRKEQNRLYETSGIYIPDFLFVESYTHCDNADIDIHTLGAAWSYQSKRQWSIKSGVNYLSREINANSQEENMSYEPLTSGSLMSNPNGSYSSFSYSYADNSHLMHTVAVTTDLNLPITRSPFGLPWRILLHLEYDYTTMESAWIKDKTLHDFVPRAIVVMPLNSTQTLTASYIRRIIRPEWEMLNPFSFDDPFTTHYGNLDLEGIHLNVASLDYKKLFTQGQFTTNVNHIFTKDGFNAIWMLKQNKRIYTWGNAGERQAWSVAPAVKYSPVQALNLHFKSTLMWDKRIASAISMEKEHWGITAEASAQAKLSKKITLDLHGLYSEGNTIDLYSHESRSLKIGTSLEIPLLSRTTLLLSADYRDYAHAIITQGAYTGTIQQSPASHIEALAKLSIRL